MIATEASHIDVVIVGAGISGINFAYRLQERTPHLSYVILEGRDSIGGTWDLFRYPGIRSDSDLYTFSFPWSAWPEKKSIAEGPLILKYIKDSAAQHGIDKNILFHHHVNHANWSSEEQAWTVDVTAEGQPKVFRSRFVLFCTGYYDYDTPLKALIPGIENFGGKVVHPQFWPEDLDYTNKDVVIIGSGATAITLLPAMAKDAGRVTMLQRSPSYIVSQPSEDKLDKLIRTLTPSTWLAAKLVRFKWIAIPWLFINFCKAMPTQAKKLLSSMTVPQLPKSLAEDPHFKPRYDPFDQRMCFCPNGDFYKALRSGKGNVVTGTIDTVTKDTIKLNDGQELHPDIIVTATGLKIRLAGGAKISVDGEPVEFKDKYIWKCTMLEDVPNAFFVIGYVDASWTLGADSAAIMTCRLLNNMAKEKASAIVPRFPKDKNLKTIPVMNLTSTYIQSAQGSVPKAANTSQWRARTSYFRDWWEAYFGDIKTDAQYIKARN